MTKLAHAFHAALDQHDQVALIDMIDPTAVVRVGSMAEGPATDWVARLKVVHTAFPDAKHVIEECLVDGDRVVSVCRLTGTHQGEFNGVAATGREISARSIHIDRFKDGKMIEHVGVLDLVTLLRQVQP